MSAPNHLSDMQSSQPAMARVNGSIVMAEADFWLLLERAAERGATLAIKKTRGMDPDEEMMETAEAAAFIGVEPDTLYRYVKAHGIEFQKGRPNKYKLKELKRLQACLNTRK
jgi:hypothetical protein